jgi:hypothetical protein
MTGLPSNENCDQNYLNPLTSNSVVTTENIIVNNEETLDFVASF